MGSSKDLEPEGSKADDKGMIGDGEFGNEAANSFGLDGITSGSTSCEKWRPRPLRLSEVYEDTA